MIGLETMAGAVLKAGIPINDFVKMQTITARNIFGITIPEIKEGQMARLTLFNPNTNFVFQKEMIHSKSANTPFIGKEMKGKVFGIINGNFSHFK